VDERTLRGPGVLDAKGGIVVMLIAAAALERTSRDLGYEILLTPDEEVGSPGSGDLIVDAAKRCGRAQHFEPAMPDGALVDSRKGSGNFALIVRGKAAHAGRDFHAGRNAIAALAELVLKIENCCADEPEITINVARIDGGGPLNVVPDLAIGRINVRVKTRQQQRIAEQRLREIMSSMHRQGITAELHGGFHAPPKELDAGSARLLELIVDCGRELGIELPHRMSGGASDGNRIAAAGIPVIDSMGPMGAELHSDREYVIVPSLVERAQLAALVMMRLS
jgi:glutamate carboxypeptidase